MKTALATILYLTLGVINSAFAIGLDGNQVTIAGYCCSGPVEADRFTEFVTRTVGDSIEYPSGTIKVIKSLRDLITSNVDISTTSIDIDYTMASSTAPGSFNGYVFEFAGVNLPRITGFTLSPLTTFAANDIDVTFDNNTVGISLPNVIITADSRIHVDLTLAPVPEPETYAMLLGGLGLLWTARKWVN